MQQSRVRFVVPGLVPVADGDEGWHIPPPFYGLGPVRTTLLALGSVRSRGRARERFPARNHVGLCCCAVHTGDPCAVPDLERRKYEAVLNCN